jgi:uncharacterized membrane protein YfcA
MSSFSLLDPRNVLLVVLGLVALFYVVVVLRATARGTSAGDKAAPSVGEVAIGYITNFFDTLGIGSFATTTAMFRLKLSQQQKKMWSIGVALLGVGALVAYRLISGVSLFAQSIWYGLTLVAVVIAAVGVLWSKGSVDDGQIPGTLNVGHTLPTIAQAFIFTKTVPVDPMTLIMLIVAAVLGAWVGAGVVSRWSKRRIQMGMGIALLAAATLLLMTLTGSNPTGGDLLKLTGAKLGIAFAGNFVLGALMTLGIGLYAPCMIMIYLLGMNPKAAFPIMMGSCAFLMPFASARFIRERRFELRASLGLLLGGVPAVLLAAFIIKSLSLTVVRWLVLVVVIYTAIGLLRAAQRERASATVPSSPPAPVTP